MAAMFPPATSLADLVRIRERADGDGVPAIIADDVDGVGGCEFARRRVVMFILWLGMVSTTMRKSSHNTSEEAL